MQTKLKIELRYVQLYRNNEFGQPDYDQPITVECDACIPSYVDGTLPDTDWHDFTNYVEGLEDLSLVWDAITNDNASELNQSTINEIGSNYSKGVSLELRFYGAAFDFISTFLMQNPCQVLNSVEVLISDLDCGQEFRIFQIKTDNLRYAPVDEPCIIAASIVEADIAAHAVATTMIEDDWQAWFNSDGAGVKDHPAFIYVVEKKPQFMLSIMMAVAYLCGMLSTGILMSLDVGKRWVRQLLGVSYFCPSPFIRTYIENFCMKHGFAFETIFDVGEPYENVCLFFPAQAYHENHTDYDSPSTKFIWNNRTGMPMDVFLDQLKKVFDCEWYITPNNTLVFKPKREFENLTPVYDFTDTMNRSLINLVYEFNGNKRPSYGEYRYQTDPQDLCSNDLKWRYNTIVDFDGEAFNPMLEGKMEKNFDFACTSFVYDGATEDFIKEAIETGRTIAQLAILVGIIAILIATGPLTAAISAALVTLGYIVTNEFINDFFSKEEIEGAIRVSSNVINVPRLLFNDSLTEDNTRAKVEAVIAPAPNLFYNPSGTDYYTLHPAFNTDDPDYFGDEVVKVYNYKMYFDEDFTMNMFDTWHSYDNPMFQSPSINQTWEADVILCCDILTAIGIWNSLNVAIGGVVVLEKRIIGGDERLIHGRIQHIGVSYKTGMIHLEGYVVNCYNP